MNEGYQQYPSSEADDIFKKMLSISSMCSQMVVHRQDKLIFYSFTKQLENPNRYFGIGLLLNGIIIKNVKKLYSILEISVTDLYISGELINWENGRVVACDSDLNDSKDETDRIIRKLNAQIDQLESFSDQIPPLSYSVSSEDVRMVRIDNDEIDKIVSQSGYSIVMQPSVYKRAIFGQKALPKEEVENDNKDLVAVSCPHIIDKCTLLIIAIIFVVIFFIFRLCGIG